MGSNPDDKGPEEERPPLTVSEDRIEAKIDRDLKDSFPASDPPGWVLGVRRPSEKKGEEETDVPSPAETDDAG